MRKLVALTVSALLASSCAWDGLNSLPMPGAEGRGAGAYEVHIQMPNVTTLTQNSPVRVHDVDVGTVTKIEVEGWHALVTVSLNPDVQLPANATAKIGQTSLLGSNHVELAAPVDRPAEGILRSGDTIPLDRAGVYPTTEQVLSSLSVVLNGGGLAQLETITRELNAALLGREDAIRDLLPQLNTLATNLDQQRTDIVAAIEGLNRVGGVLAHERDTVAAALEGIHPGLGVLAEKRKKITDAVVALGQLSDVSSRIIATGGADLKANLAALAPVLRTLADTGRNLTDILTFVATFPFPMKNLDRALKGDYLNLMMTVDLRQSRLDSNFLTGTPLGGMFGGVEGIIGRTAGVAGQGKDPATAPLNLPPAPTPVPTIPGLPPIPGLPAIPGLTVPGGPPR